MAKGRCKRIFMDSIINESLKKKIYKTEQKRINNKKPSKKIYHGAIFFGEKAFIFK